MIFDPSLSYDIKQYCNYSFSVIHFKLEGVYDELWLYYWNWVKSIELFKNEVIRVLMVLCGYENGKDLKLK